MFGFLLGFGSRKCVIRLCIGLMRMFIMNVLRFVIIVSVVMCFFRFVFVIMVLL